MEVSDLNDGQLIAAYRRARERRDNAKTEFSKSQEPLLKLMGHLEAEALRRMQERGTDSFKSKEFGTCYTSTDVSVTTSDKSAFFDWLQETGQWELADVRPAKKEVQNFAENTGGDLPPGVDMSMKLSARFRAPTNK